VVTDEPDKYPSNAGFPADVTIHHRDELDLVQRELREITGVTGLIYDQTCAAEKRRRRKRGRMPDPPKRVFINELVCEGCGDCGTASNCLSVVPLETEFGRKRAIDQSSCNKDFSCLNGFCPSFISVHGGNVRKSRAAETADAPAEVLPLPTLPSTAEPYNILVTGIGGTGIVTIGALLAMAAHLEGKGCTVLDMTGLAQKGGAVVSHLRIADNQEDLHAVRIAAGGAKLLLGCDLMVSSQPDTLGIVAKGDTHAVINRHKTFTGDFTRDPDMVYPEAELETAIRDAVGDEQATFLEATRQATALLGDSIATNMFMTGIAFQKGLIPLSLEAIERAIELNGVATEMNKQAFAWGRRAAFDPGGVERIAAPAAGPARLAPATEIDDTVARRKQHLTAYQDAAYAKRYELLVRRIEVAEAAQAKGRRGLAEAVARYYFKLLAYKDEYEVARLYADPTFRSSVEAQFEGDYKIAFHLAPPLLARRDPTSGRPRKMQFGAWMMPVFGLLARLKGLRGTRFDLFGLTEERRTERRLITEYETVVEELIENLDQANHPIAVEIASVPERIRGFGHVKTAHLADAKRREVELLATFRNPTPQASAAE
jgi:indolepyruvate ferredoxin oxidoreductase